MEGGDNIQDGAMPAHSNDSRRSINRDANVYAPKNWCRWRQFERHWNLPGGIEGSGVRWDGALCCETAVPDFETDPREYFAYLGATEESSDREFCETDYDLDVGDLKICAQV